MMTIRVLLADDHAIMLEGLVGLIESQEGFEIIGTAQNGVEAVKLAEEHKPDLVVIDITMPEMDGIEATKHIVRNKPDTKVLGLSMHSEHAYITEMFNVGASGYLLKDSALAELLDAIRIVMDGRRFLSTSLVDVVLGEPGSPSEPTPFDVLTKREREILELLLRGQTAKEISYDLDLSPKTVFAHRHHLMQKLGVDNIVDLIRLAVKYGLIEM